MEFNIFDNLLSRSHRFVDRDMERLKMLDFIYKQIIKIIKKMYSENPELSSSDVENTLYSELLEFSTKLTRDQVKPYVFGNMIQNDLRNNPVALKKAYDIAKHQIDEDFIKRVKSNQEEFKLSDYETMKIDLVKSFIVKLQMAQYDKITSKLKHKEIDDAEFDKNKMVLMFLANKSHTERTKWLKENGWQQYDKLDIYPYFRGTEVNQLEYWLREDGVDFEKKAKDTCINNIIMTIDFLNKYGIIDEKLFRRNRMYTKCLCKMTENEIVSECIGDLVYNKDELLELFSREKLEKCSIKQLLALNAEWSNITAKSINDINKMLFLIKQLGITQKIKEGNYEFSLELIDKEKLRAVFQKVSIVKGLIDVILNKIAINDPEINTSEEALRISKGYSKQYQKHFSINFPNSNNDIMEDFYCYNAGEIIRDNLYKLKNDNMLALVSAFQNDSWQINWGVRLENNRESIEDDEFVLLSFDVNELIMPVGLHIKKSLLKDYMNNVLNSPDIRVYAGADDFVTDYYRITTNGNCRMNAKYMTALNKIVNSIDETDKLYNFIMHLNYLRNYSKYPKSMQQAKVQGNKIKYKKSISYIDLDSEQVISQTEHSKLVKEFILAKKNNSNIDDQDSSDIDNQEL